MTLTQEEKFNQMVWWLLKELKIEILSSTSKTIYLDIKTENKDNNVPSSDNQRRAIRALVNNGAIRMRREKYPLDMMKIGAELYNWKPIGHSLEILPGFDKLYLKYEKKYSATEIGEINTKQILLNKLIITVRDREIWVNNYLIGKPHAIGSNFEFFEHVRLRPPHTKIDRSTLSNFGGSSSLKEQIEGKSFIKILNGLGFKGEILRAFFYKRSKNTLIYRGDKITNKDLKKAGIKITLLLKELELANTKNSPE